MRVFYMNLVEVFLVKRRILGQCKKEKIRFTRKRSK